MDDYYLLLQFAKEKLKITGKVDIFTYVNELANRFVAVKQVEKRFHHKRSCSRRLQMNSILIRKADITNLETDKLKIDGKEKDAVFFPSADRTSRLHEQLVSG